MELIRDCLSLRRAFPGSVLTVGNFDGVHVGHQRILSRVVDEARAASVAAVVFTFEPHPAAILEPGRAPERILTFQHKLGLFEDAGIDAVLCPDDPRRVLAMTAEAFIRRIVLDGIGAAVVIEGPDFHLGSDRKGCDELRRRSRDELGFRLEVIAAVTAGGVEVSSTRIRALVREGRVADARRMLGRPFEFVGRVVPGRRRGHRLGFPTVNVEGTDFLVPGEGVYAGWAGVLDASSREATGPFAAAISVGRAPTFGELTEPVVEACLLDFDGDLYGRIVCLEFIDRLRDQETFAGAEALAEQVARDRGAVRARLASEHGP